MAWTAGGFFADGHKIRRFTDLREAPGAGFASDYIILIISLHFLAGFLRLFSKNMTENAG